jgi:hypothetical protein
MVVMDNLISTSQSIPAFLAWRHLVRNRAAVDVAMHLADAAKLMMVWKINDRRDRKYLGGPFRGK